MPGTSVLLERTEEYERAGLPIDRLFRVYVWSARSTPDTLVVMLEVPPGLKADSSKRVVALPAFGGRDVFFRLRAPAAYIHARRMIDDEGDHVRQQLAPLMHDQRIC